MATPKEQWRFIPGWIALYEVSDRGRVRACERTVRSRTPLGAWTVRKIRRLVLKPRPNRRGHLRVMLHYTLIDGSDTRRLHAYVHRLVAEAFHGPAPEGTMALHRDDNKRNNAASNIYYGTRIDNAQDALRNGCHGTEAHRRRKKGRRG